MTLKCKKRTKWSDTFRQFVGKLLTNYLSVFDRFVGLALKGLRAYAWMVVKTFKKKKMTLEGSHWNRCGAFVVNFKHISNLFSCCFYCCLRTVNAGWVYVLIEPNRQLHKS